jgi:PAS domain S-box-containing protein
MFGYSPRELVGHEVEMLVLPEVRDVHVAYRNGFLNSVRKREMGYHPPIEALRKDGSTIWLDIALTATQATDDVMVVCRPVQASTPTTPLVQSG